MNEDQGVDFAVKIIRKSENKFEDFTSNLCNAAFRPVFERTSIGNVKHFGMSGKPITIMEHLYHEAKQFGQVTISENKWKMSTLSSKDSEKGIEAFKMQIELHEVEVNEKYVVSVSRKGGSEQAY